KSGEIGIIEIPENSTNDLKHYYNLELNNNELIYTNKVLGKLSELTDKDCEEFVQCSFPFDGQYTKTYKNYSQKRGKDNTPWERSEKMWFISAKKSFTSLLQSESADTSNEDKLLIIKIL
ncbi:MAG: hypothetical protein M0R03_23250, partial [Novosphingobium sp.]|nr:hypothetical protein [Novosphingobium sp.]